MCAVIASCSCDFWYGDEDEDEERAVDRIG